MAFRFEVLAATLLAGCGVGGVANDGGADAGQLDAGVVDSGSPQPCNCGAGSTCVTLTVGRVADAAQLPWVAFSGMADGVGTLVASLLLPGTGSAVARATVADADLTSASASYAVNLGCVASGQYDARAFLDDNTNALPTAVSSGDYRDACMSPRFIPVTVGTTPLTASLALAISCD